MDLGLQDRAFVVTGGSKGLGLAAARALVAEGARVVLSSRDQANVAEAARGLGEAARGVAADLADPEAPSRLVAAAHEHFGRLDGALVSVGGPPVGTGLSNTDEEWRAAFESVFLGAVRCVRAVAEDLGDRAGGDEGSIALVLSTSAREPIPGLAISNGLRPGLGMLVKTWADELGPRGTRVTGLLPGRLATDRTLSLDPDPDARAQREAGIPLRRYGEPDELGRVAAFLLSPAASYLTGILVPVDGGAARAL